MESTGPKSGLKMYEKVIPSEIWNGEIKWKEESQWNEVRTKITETKNQETEIQINMKRR